MATVVTLDDATEAYTNKGGNAGPEFRKLIAPAIKHYNNLERMPRNGRTVLPAGVTIADVLVFAGCIAMIKRGKL